MESSGETKDKEYVGKKSFLFYYKTIVVVIRAGEKKGKTRKCSKDVLFVINIYQHIPYLTSHADSDTRYVFAVQNK